LGRVLLLPPRLVLASLETAFRAGRVVGSVPVRVSRRTTRLLGFRGTVALLVGVALGLALAPVPGRELRAWVCARLTGAGGVSDADLAERVTFELEHAPRTWHLAQPRVTVAAGRVVLSGDVPPGNAREELGRVAGAVPGVASVDNLLIVTGGDDHDAGTTAGGDQA
jgi:hypothetical protein